MAREPQRPFVPHRTPKTARPTITASEFRLYRPFLPGAQEVRPIEDFLDTSAGVPIVYAQVTSEDAYATESVVEPDELPPVEHFLDPLPPVYHFAPEAEGALSDAWPAESGEVAPAGAAGTTDVSESGWIETDWQHYDWRAVAALGESAERAASSAWATTDWDGAVPRARELRRTAAHAIATALDEIAQRIREGELALPGQAAMSDPAKLAATLAALLGVRR